MNKKNVFVSVLFIFIVIIGLNYCLIKKVNSYVYNNMVMITSSIIEKYPDSEEEIIDLIKNNKVNYLAKYGIKEDTLDKLNSYHNLKIYIITLVSISILVIGIYFLLFYYFIKLKIKKEINIINNYLTEILRGIYDGDFSSYNEDELSILKNDIYKVTVKLKEYSEYEMKEKKYLVEVLEDITHQLKTPLTALMVTNDILKNNNLTVEERSNFLNKQTKELEKMEWLIITLLNMSKLDSGYVKLKQENVKVKDLIKDAISSLSIPLDLKEVNVSFENLDFNIICDTNWTKEAIINILKNATEHVSKGGEIKIIGDDNPLYKSISIRDNGSGISKKDIKNIFKRFYSVSGNKNSVGIGLNLAKIIIEKQNGKIEVESVEGKYTTFKIIFNKEKVI